MTTETTSITVQQRAAVALGSSKAEAELRELAAKSKSITVVTNKDGRQECHAAAMVAKEARISIEKAGKAAREDATAFSKAVISEEKRLVDMIKPEEDRLILLRDQYDAAEKARKEAAEAAERARIAAIKEKIEAIRRGPMNASMLDANGAQAVLDMAEEVEIDDSFAEFRGEALEAKADAVEKLRAIVSAKVSAEATAAKIKAEQEAEAARLEQERQRLAAERAEQERIASEQRAAEQRRIDEERSRMEAERAELERQRQELAKAQREAAEKAAAEKREAEAKAAEEQAERDRIAAEEIRQQDAERKAVTAQPALQSVNEAITREFSQTYPNGAPMFDKSNIKENGDPVMLNPDGKRSVFCDVDEGNENPTGKTMNLGQINAALGFTVSADFLGSLGMLPVRQEKAAKLYDANKLPTICRLIQEHLAKVMQQSFKQAA